MPQIYKIYMNQSAIHIADIAPKNTDKYQSIDYEEIDISKVFRQSKDKKAHQPHLLITKDPEATFKRLKRPFKIIKAAGGIVKNGKGEHLFIYRLGYWDLPKGKVDEGEKMETAAVREVEEECGIDVHYRGICLATTYHLYTLKGELVIKKTKWYDMGVNKSPKLTPQKAEDITKAEWLGLNDLEKVRKKTYPLILDLLPLLERYPQGQD